MEEIFEYKNLFNAVLKSVESRQHVIFEYLDDYDKYLSDKYHKFDIYGYPYKTFYEIDRIFSSGYMNVYNQYFIAGHITGIYSVYYIITQLLNHKTLFEPDLHNILSDVINATHLIRHLDHLCRNEFYNEFYGFITAYFGDFMFDDTFRSVILSFVEYYNKRWR